MSVKRQAEVNIGVVGHVDHGKTSLTSKLTGRWTDKHSEEVKQGISIKLGYADAEFYKDDSLEGISAYTTHKKHPLSGNKTEIVRKVSFVDAPGHETLMAVMLSGATLLDGAILVVSANEHCPQPRTVEHLQALKLHGIKNLVVAQNKIDLVTKEDALKNHKKLREFLDSEGYKDAPIIPTSAHFDTNIDALIYALIENIPVPKFDKTAPLKMQVVRSFDINKPGNEIKDINGGVLGGAVLQGSAKIGQEVWLYPGLEKPVKITIKSLNSSGVDFKEVFPGGLIAVGTDLDPFYCTSDKMVGQLICDEDAKPFMSDILELEYNKIERLLEQNKTPLIVGEKIVLIIGSAAYVGQIKKSKDSKIEVVLNRPAVYYKEDTIAISRNINSRWRLSGYGKVK